MTTDAATDITVEHIHRALRRLGGFDGVYIPEFTWKDRRVDALVMDIRKRWARGFEIKLTRSDFLRDDKYLFYSEFCSSLSIVCPRGLIRKEEVPDPFGLLYVFREPGMHVDPEYPSVRWEKKPKRFQRRDGLAWLWTYLGIIEKELPRLVGELDRIHEQKRRSQPDQSIADERARIERDVMKVVGGIAATHRWFPINDVLKAIHGGK